MSVRAGVRRFLGTLVTSVITATAAAEEREPAAPCREDASGNVICEAEGFTTLVTKCSGYRSDRDLCRIDREELTKKLATTRASLDLCLNTPVPQPPPAPWSPKPAVTLILGAVGTGLLISTAALASAPTDTKVILGTAGLVAVGTGLWLAF